MKERVVVVVDGGGRGSALVDKYAQSKDVDRIISTPGNDLMHINTDKRVEIYPQVKTTNIKGISEICERELEKGNEILVDVAQDNAVETGLADALKEKGIPTVGPTRLAGQIEWDKAWSREFGEEIGLPQPLFKICLSEKDGIDFIESQKDKPRFIKAAFLAEGKGAIPAKNNKEAIEVIKEISRTESGKVYLIEEWLKGDSKSKYEKGEEFSTFVFSDGRNYKIIGSAQDHKRVFDGDKGPNTGGMGCSSPPLVLTPEILENIEVNILAKTIQGMNGIGRPYTGVLYLGGMVLRREGTLKPYVIEFNARWGDPEAQVILPGLINDLYEVSMSIANGDISKLDIQTDGKSRIVVAGASKGYPVDYNNVKGREIYGIEHARRIDGIKIYGAGVKRVDGRDYANGGRLFYLVAEGTTVIDAREKAYEAMGIIKIDGNNLHYRTDIGWRDVDRYLKQPQRS